MNITGYVKAPLGLNVRQMPINGRKFYALPWKHAVVIDAVMDLGGYVWAHVKLNDVGRGGWVSMNWVQTTGGDYASPAVPNQMLTRIHKEIPEADWNKGSFMHWQLTNDPKKGKAHSINLGAAADRNSWAYYIRSLNSAKAWQWMVDENGTKDLLSSPDDGKTITIPCQLVGGNENIVNVGQVKGGYTEIIGLSIYDAYSGYMLGNPPSADAVNYETRPDLVHQIFGCSQRGEPFNLTCGPVYMPVINPRGMRGAGLQTKIWMESRFLKEM